jgi:hypothetical protein
MSKGTGAQSGGSIGPAKAADDPRNSVTSTESAATAFFIDIPSCFWIKWYNAIVRGRELAINYR